LVTREKLELGNEKKGSLPFKGRAGVGMRDTR